MVTQAVVRDRAYDATSFIESITQTGARAVIPPHENRQKPRVFDTHLNKHQNLVERFFCRLKQFRPIATRYDKLTSRFFAFIAIVAAFIWLVWMSTDPSKSSSTTWNLGWE